MQIGVDRFVAALPDPVRAAAIRPADRLRHLPEENTLRGPTGTLMIGDPATVAEKMLHVDEALVRAAFPSLPNAAFDPLARAPR